MPSPPQTGLSIVIATRNRWELLVTTLESLAIQTMAPKEILVIDASSEAPTPAFVEIKERWQTEGLCPLRHIKAEAMGAGPQRNQGFSLAKSEGILSLDDDILLEADCLEHLWNAFTKSSKVMAVTATITNQGYHQPGKVAKFVFAFLNGKALPNYAGRCIGPGLTQLPEDREGLPASVPVEWAGTGCTVYRADALPHPVFAKLFHGASLCEDLTLSLQLGKVGDIVNATKARVFHANGQGDHKRSEVALAKMELINRYFVLTRVLEKRSAWDHVKFAVMMSYLTLGRVFQPGGIQIILPRLYGFVLGALRLPRRSTYQEALS